MPDREKVITDVEEAIKILGKVEEPTFWLDFVKVAVENALKLLKGQTISGWISVKDRMPEFEGDYLVTDGHSVPWKCRMIKLGESKGFINSALKPVVKYWMPLPEPPEVDK